MITEFLIKYWEFVVIGLLLLNTIIQKLEKIKGNSDILTWLWMFLVWVTDTFKKLVSAVFSTTPGKLPIIFIGFFLVGLLLVGQAFAADVTFEWDSNTESDISHYNCYRSDDGQATWSKVNVDPILHTGAGTETWTELGVPDGIYHWYGTAVDTEDNESGPSNIVTATIDTAAPAPPQNFIIALIQKIIAWIKGLFSSFRFA
jgi:hypothetical protein